MRGKFIFTNVQLSSWIFCILGGKIWWKATSHLSHLWWQIWGPLEVIISEIKVAHFLWKTHRFLSKFNLSVYRCFRIWPPPPPLSLIDTDRNTPPLYRAISGVNLSPRVTWVTFGMDLLARRSVNTSSFRFLPWTSFSVTGRVLTAVSDQLITAIDWIKYEVTFSLLIWPWLFRKKLLTVSLYKSSFSLKYLTMKADYHKSDCFLQ